jgi:hypothetical protein
MKPCSLFIHSAISILIGMKCYWIYCRMIVLNSLLTSSPLPLLEAHWQCQIQYFQQSPWCFDVWANKTVYLLATAHDLLHGARGIRDSDALTELKSKWLDLQIALAKHKAQRPKVCSAIGVLPAEPGELRPFVEIIYVTPSVGM